MAFPNFDTPNLQPGLKRQAQASQHREEIDALRATHAQQVEHLTQRLEHEKASLVLAGTEAPIFTLTATLTLTPESTGSDGVARTTGRPL